jgi:hypothetical protein
LKELDNLLTQWNQAMQREFKSDPETVILLGDQILLGNRIISALQAQNTNLKNFIKHLQSEDRETLEPWLAQYDIPYDCAWRDAIDELIHGTEREDDLAIQFFNALNDAGVKYRISTDGSMDYPNEEEKAKGEAILARIEEGIQRCRVCGCTDDRACPGGCYWVETDLCSACVGLEGEK